MVLYSIFCTYSMFSILQKSKNILIYLFNGFSSPFSKRESKNSFIAFSIVTKLISQLSHIKFDKKHMQIPIK